MMLLPTPRQAMNDAPTTRGLRAMSAEPSTPRQAKRRRLDRQQSDEKENLSRASQISVDNTFTKASEEVVFGRINTSTLGKARSPFQLLQPQAQDTCGVAPAPAPVECRSEVYPLVGREEECGTLDQFFQQSLGNGPGKGRCLYISGGPGTGKTCSVRASVNNFRRQAPDTSVIEVNCMDLTQRSVSGVLQQLLIKCNRSRAAGMSMQGLAALVTSSLGQLAKRVVIVVDEVDQLVSRSGRKAAADALSLETLFSLPQLPGAPAVAVIAIANAVDLLERSTAAFASRLNCGALLFQPYSKDQLKSIVTTRVKSAEGGDAALKALGPVKVQLRVTQVAKESGDCRQVMSLIEEALFEAKTISQAARVLPSTTATSTLPPAEGEDASTTTEPAVALSPKRDPKTLIKTNRNDPLQTIQSLPLEQQILLATLATSKHEATKLSDICKRYKELCRDMKQPENLGSKGQVTSALSALEHRGLLAMRSQRGAAPRRGKQPPMLTETTVELWVACDELLKRVTQAKPELKKFIRVN